MSDDESEAEAEDFGEVHATEVEGFTQWEVERAKKCRKLLHDLSAPSYADLRKLLRMNLLKNCPVTHEDVVLAKKSFGKDVAVLKGKEIKPRPPVVDKSDVVDLPPELMETETELAIDVVFVENEAFLHCVDRKLKGKSVVPLGTTKKAKGEDLLERLVKVVRYYNKADVTVSMIHADNEFRSITEAMEEDWKLDFNFADPDEHVLDIERENRMLQERFRSEYHRLPFKVLPKQMIRALI